jgi:hypothetical protein
MTDLQRAVNVLEAAAFHVDRAYEEDRRDAGCVSYTDQDNKTGAICLRITPEKTGGGASGAPDKIDGRSLEWALAYIREHPNLTATEIREVLGRSVRDINDGQLRMLPPELYQRYRKRKRRRNDHT